jgi:hypothetical protein
VNALDGFLYSCMKIEYWKLLKLFQEGGRRKEGERMRGESN